MTTMSEHQPVFSNIPATTNMPFFDGKTLVFGQSAGTVNVNVPATGTIWKTIRQNKALAERMKNLPRSSEVTYRPWKLAYCDWSDKIVRPIATGLPANAPERAPVFYWEDGRVHLSFLSGGVASGGFFYRLYTCSGPDLGRLDAPQAVSDRPTFFGFFGPHHLCEGTGRTIRLTEKKTGRAFQLETSFYRVASVNFVAENPAQLVISGIVDREHNPHTVLYDLATGQVSDLSVGGPVYKATLFGKHAIFAEKQKGEFEQRELRQGEVTLSPSAIRISKGE